MLSILLAELVAYLSALVMFILNGGNLIQGVILSGTIFLIGSFLDELSTYFFILEQGKEKFFQEEINPECKKAVIKYGPKRGTLITHLLPKCVLSTTIAILYFAIPAFGLGLILHYRLSLSVLLAFVFGFCFMGLTRLIWALSNFLSSITGKGQKL